jgi:type I restriction enzyme, S subunit
MKVAAVRDICEQVRGVTYAKSDASDFPRSGYTPILRANNISDSGLIYDDLVFVRDARVSPKQRVLPNDVVVAASSGSISVVGKAAQAREGFDGGFGAFCKVLRPSPEIDPWYFGHYFRTPAYRNVVSNLAAGANINNLKNEHLNNLQIPLPPLAEQKRVAAILDAADALRAKRRESIEQLDLLIKSTFLEMFGDPVTNPKGWEVVVIGDLLASANYGTSKKADVANGTYPILRMGNITYSGGWDFESLKYIDLDEKEVGKHLVHQGEILFNRTNSKELVGKTAVYREDQPMAFAGYLVRGVVNEAADPEYIGAFMNTPQIKQFLRNKCKSIVGMANINAKEFQAIPIAAPPIDLQQRFGAIVESIEKQKAAQKAQLEEFENLFASLQHNAFNGTLWH